MWVFFFCILKEIKLNHRRHPRAGGDPLRSGCFLYWTLTHPCHRGGVAAAIQSVNTKKNT